MEEKRIELIIDISEETYERIQNIVNYYNGKRLLLKEEKPQGSIETFIKGAITTQLEEYETILKPVLLKESEFINSGKLKNNFKEIAKDEGLRHIDIAMLTDIDSTTLSQIFNNHQQPSLDFFLRIWSVLDFPPIRRCFYRE